MNIRTINIHSLLLVCLLPFLSFSLAAMEKKTFCVWDPVGRNGPVMTFYSDVIPKALAWGLDIKFVSYTEETEASRDFKAGKCEAVVLTSILSREFVKFAGTMDAIGAISSEKGLELAIATLARAKAGNLMKEGDYEVVTTFPVGSMYAFVKDRSVDTIDDFSGKSIAILNSDPQMRKFADLAGASQIDVTLSNFAGKFNRGELDILIMPALAYNTFELYEGLGDAGGIIDYRLYYGMLQTISKQAEFPEDFGSNMRNYMITRMKAISKMVRDAEEEIPEKYWIETNQFVKDDINHFSKRVRLALQDDDVNNPMALKLFWKIRCRLDPSRGECKEFPAKKSKRDKQLADKKKQQERSVAKRKLVEQQRKKEQENLKKKAEQERLEKEQQEKNKIALELEKLKAQKLALAEARRALEKERLALEKERDQAAEGSSDAAMPEDAAGEQAEDQASPKLVVPQEVAKNQDLGFEQSLAGASGEVSSEAAAEKAETESRSIWDILFGWMF